MFHEDSYTFPKEDCMDLKVLIPDVEKLLSDAGVPVAEIETAIHEKGVLAAQALQNIVSKLAAWFDSGKKPTS